MSENVLERMKRLDSDKKIADFMAKEKMPYSFKKKYAAIRAREFAAECERRGLNYHVSIEGKFRNFAQSFRRKSNIGMVYCLTNYNSTMEEDLYRIYTLRDLGYDPYVMIYDKPHAPKGVRNLQRWCNNKIIFGAEPDFKKFTG